MNKGVVLLVTLSILTFIIAASHFKLYGNILYRVIFTVVMVLGSIAMFMLKYSKVYIAVFAFIMSMAIVLLWVTNTQEKNGTDMDLYYFYTSWCPYCKKSRAEWDKFKAEWNAKTYNGYVIKFQEVDCDINESLADKYKIEKYPTILLIKNNKVYEHDAKPTVESLTQFLMGS